jgi:hypothetical protein
VTPGTSTYWIGSPLFDKAVLHLPSGKDFTVVAKGAGEGKHFISIRGFSTTAISGSQPLVSVLDTSDVWIRDAAAPDNTESFLAAKGESSSNILVSGSDLRGVRNFLTSDSKEGAVTMKENVER